MQVVKVHKKRVFAIAMAMSTFILLVSVATIGHQQMLNRDWTYSSDATRPQNESLWRFRYNLLESISDGNQSVLNWTSALPLSATDKGTNPKADVVQTVSEEEEAGHEEVIADEDSYTDERDGENDGPDDILGEYDDGSESAIGDYDDYGSENGDEENDNGVFRDGDFDSSTMNATQVDDIGGATKRQKSVPEVDVPTYVFRNSTSQDNESREGSRTLEATTHGFIIMGHRIGDRKLHSKLEPVNHKTGPSPVEQLSVILPKGSRSRMVKRGTKVTPVSDGIFWSEGVEQLAPKGFSDQYVEWFLSHVRSLQVTSMSPPAWNRCGRPKNQLVTFSDGSHACARYRSPHDYLVQGEVMSFYLARLLGIYNVPIVVLSKVDSSSDQWSGPQLNGTLRAAGWEENTTVAFIQWIDGLERDHMPDIILNALKTWKTTSVGTKKLNSLPPDKLVELLQWSDLIVFDYITGNYDRVASMQDAAEKESRPEVMHDTIHNLVKSRNTHSLWLIDNESGLLDAYSLMYTRNPFGQGKRFIEFHLQMLHTMCIFRQSTFSRIESLRHSSIAHRILLDYIDREEPLFGELPNVARNMEFAKHFQHRINEVYEWMTHCKRHSKKYRHSS